MNREIEFRGKVISSYDKKSDGKWVYGDFFRSGTNVKINTFIGGVWYVALETVGQYTEVLDKNGTKVFDGDIVKDKHGNIGLVFWEKNMLTWMIDYSKYGKTYLAQEFVYADILPEVIGNIHDNPELLGAKK